MARSSNWVGKTIIILAVLGGAGTGGWYYFRGKSESPPRIQSAPVQRGSIVQAVTATGQLETVVKTDVSSQISGRILEVLVDFNSPVKKGDVLARIDPATYESACTQAENELLNAKANYKLVRANAERSKTLFSQNLISQADLDTIQAQLEQAEVQIRIREAALESRRTDLSRCTLYAPIDGIVIDRLAEVGKMVAASLNAPTLFTIVNDLTKMQINAAVAEADIGNVKVGQQVEFTVDAFTGEKFNGRVTQIRNLPVTAQNVVVYATIIEVSNEKLKLKPGMTANVQVIIDRRDNALRVPNAAMRARVPEEFLPPAPAVAATPGAVPAAPAAAESTDPQEQRRALMREAGWDGNSRPTPEIMEKVRQLAAQRGIQLPERGSWGGGGGGEGGARRERNPISATPTIVTRTLYKLLEEGPKPKIEPVTVKLGITDGSTTEVLEGLQENDVVITSFTIPGAAATAAPGGSSPLGGTMRRF
jgi:HlyD family secretion protein